MTLPSNPNEFAQSSSYPTLLEVLQRGGVASFAKLSPSVIRLSEGVLLVVFFCAVTILRPQKYHGVPQFKLLPVHSPLLKRSLLFSFPENAGVFRFPPLTSPSCLIVSVLRVSKLSRSRVYKSEIAYACPRLVTTYRILRHLHRPERPPYTLGSLIFIP